MPNPSVRREYELWVDSDGEYAHVSDPSSGAKFITNHRRGTAAYNQIVAEIERHQPAGTVNDFLHELGKDVPKVVEHINF